MTGQFGASSRVVILMLDGLGLDCYEQSSMPVMKCWADTGLFVKVEGVMPSVTNANNVSICCGCFPDTHGAVGNSWLDETSGQEEYLEFVGVAHVMSRAAAAQAMRLMPDRIGDLVVLGDRDTAFGHLGSDEFEDLPLTYRNHESTYQLDVPLIIHNTIGAPGRSYFSNNLDLARWV